MNRRTVLLALILSISAAWIASALMKKGGLFGSGDKGPEVLVAKDDIAMREILSDILFVKQPVPPGLFVKNMVTKLDPKRKHFALHPIVKGEILYQGKMGVVDAEPELSYMIDRNQGVITIAVTAVTGVSGILKPGDYVDVYATYIKEQLQGLPAQKRPAAITKRIVSGCKVVAVGNDVVAPTKSKDAASNFNRKRTGGEPKRVTLAANDSDMERIVYAQTNGKIHLALKPDDDKSKGMPAGYSTTDMQEDLFTTIECIRADKSELVRVDR